jgi:Tfp pilus assembly protein FimT
MVLAILGILSVVAVSMISNRRGAAVRALMDELEGALSNGRNEAVATSRDVALDCWGDWTAATPAVVAFGDASLTDAQIQTFANDLLGGTLPPVATQYSGTVVAPFHFLPNDVTQSRARVVVVGSGDWATAYGANPTKLNITNVPPFTAGGSMNGILVDANNFFNPNPATPSTPPGIIRQTVSGISQCFTTTYFIEIVGTSPSGGPIPGCPMGLLVMLAGGSSIYRFYNPGTLEGDGKWRRI